jgi:hypothetical protein
MPAVDLEVATTDVLQRMLARLPKSLWDGDATSNTLQRDLYQAFAAQMAVWIEQREIARTMALMLEAQGVDLDVLLEDYGLRRYLRRPDPYARQVGMHLLWTPKGTLYSLQILADLLFDAPHVTLRTGRGQQHVFIAATHPITTPYSYWGLVSAEGLWYAVAVDGEVPTISQAPPPGLNVAPGPHTLTWFTVRDEVGAPWYVSIHGDTLRVETTQPAGYGTTEPFAVLDGQGNRWLLQVHASEQALLTVLDTGLPGFGTWQLRDQAGTLYRLWIEARVPTIATTAPGGSTDQTPGGAALDWLAVPDASGTLWYLFIQHDTLVVTPTAPGGSGSATVVQLLDAGGQRWVLTVDSGETAVVATATDPYNAPLLVAAPDAPFQAFRLSDSDGVPWWVCLDGDTLFLTPTMPLGVVDLTPAGGPYRWWRVYDLAGTLWYAFPSTLGSLTLETFSPGGLGTVTPQTLGDRQGVLWHVGVDPAGNIGMSNTPSVDYAGMATAICLADATGARWFWRVQGHVVEWSSALWPDTLDQSPWGDLGWLQVANEDGVTRYVSPTPLGDPIVTSGPPIASPWGWQAPVTFLDGEGTPWHLTVLRDDDRLGIESGFPDDLPLPTEALPLREAVEAFAHIQAAGSLLTVLIT